MIPKVELHVHIEGTLSPDLVKKIAVRNGLAVPKDIFQDEKTYRWKDFLDFLQVFDQASAVLKTTEDYRDMVYTYLTTSAAQGVIYTEFFYSPDHAALCGLSYQDSLAGCVQGIDDAYRETGIISRIIVTGVRHFGAQACKKVAEKMLMHPHPYVVGFGLGGDEAAYPAHLFVDAFKIAHEAGFGTTVHAGEMRGADSIWEALQALPVSRVGHGVRAIEDPHLLDYLIERQIALEICPGSNIALGVYPSYATHPFKQLWEAGVLVTLSSDDPPFFGTNMQKEYEEIGREAFALTDQDLLAISRTAVEVSFAEPAIKKQLLSRIEV